MRVEVRGRGGALRLTESVDAMGDGDRKPGDIGESTRLLVVDRDVLSCFVGSSDSSCHWRWRITDLVAHYTNDQD